MTDPASVAAEPHPFHDEWRFQRSMSRGNPMAGKPIAPDQPCFDCGVAFASHGVPASVAAEEALTAESARAVTEFSLYQKTARTLISDRTFPPGTPYQTPEGLRAEDEETRAALDVQGGIYPIRESVFRASYTLDAARSRPASVEGERRLLAHEYELGREAGIREGILRERQALAALPASTESGSRVDVERLRKALAALHWTEFAYHDEGFVDLADDLAAEYARLAPSEPEAPGPEGE